jgi:hypothetical protein
LFAVECRRGFALAGKSNTSRGSIRIRIEKVQPIEIAGLLGWENLEDYNADFMTMLETWEAAVNFKWKSKGYRLSESAISDRLQPIEVARILGWTLIPARAG